MQIEQQNKTSLDISGLTKSFGRTRVLNGLNISINAGEVLSVLGSNGSGKTTLINIISMLTKADRGTVNLYGNSIESQPNQIRSYIGVVGHAPMLYSDMNGLENLKFFGRMFRVDDLNERISEIAVNTIERKITSQIPKILRRL